MSPAEQLTRQPVSEGSPFIRFWHGHYPAEFLGALRAAGAEHLGDTLDLAAKDLWAVSGRDRSWRELLGIFQARLRYALRRLETEPQHRTVRVWLNGEVPDAESGHIGARGAQARQLPGASGLTDEERQLLKEWDLLTAGPPFQSAAVEVLQEYGFDPQFIRCLTAARVKKVRDILTVTPGAFLSQKGVGPQRLRFLLALQLWLKKHGAVTDSLADSLREMGVSSRLADALAYLGVSELSELQSVHRDDLATLDGVGVRTVQDFDRLVESTVPAECTEGDDREFPALVPGGGTPLAVPDITVGPPEAFSESVLRMPLSALEPTSDSGQEALAASWDEVLVRDLGLSDDTLAELESLTLSPDDSLSNLLGLSLGYLCTHLRSEKQLEELVLGLSRMWGTPPNATDERVLTAAQRCQVGGALVRAAPIPWSAFPLGEEQRSALQRAYGATCGDALGETEAAVLSAAPTVSSGLRTLTALYSAAAATDAATVAAVARDWQCLRTDGPMLFVANFVRETLASRHAEVWLRRGGIDGRNTHGETLQEIADSLHISRERVRQMESQAEKTLRTEWRRQPTAPTVDRAVVSALSACLGCAEAAAFARVLREQFAMGTDPTIQDVYSLQHLLGEFGVADGRLAHSGRCRALEERARRHVIARFAAMTDDRINIADLLHDLNRALSSQCWCDVPRRPSPIPCCGAADAAAKLPRAYVERLLAEACPNAVDGDWVWNPDWTALRHGPKKVDAVRGALRTAGKPTHYSLLAERLRQHSVQFSDLSERGVHACLTTYDFFVPTGRGEYGLVEWGVEKHRTVADRMEDLLRRRGEPILLVELVRVLDREGVPEGHVHAAVGQTRFIVTNEHGGRTVTLADWLTEEATEQSDRHELRFALPTAEGGEPPLLFAK